MEIDSISTWINLQARSRGRILERYAPNAQPSIEFRCLNAGVLATSAVGYTLEYSIYIPPELRLQVHTFN